MCLFGCNSNSGGSASGTPTPSPSASAGRDAGSSCVSCCPIFVVRSLAVATLPADRARTNLGIGEETNLSTDPATAVTWTIAGDDGSMGTLSTASGTTTKYTACDRGKSVTINAARSCGRSATIAFTVIQMGGGTLESPTDVSVIAPPSIAVGFTATPTGQPANVSFLNCEMREGTCPADATGIFAFQAGQVHPDTGSWVPFSANVDANGTPITTFDTIKTTMDISTFPTGGTVDGRFHWAIPWRVQVRGGGTSGPYVFATPDHVKAYTASTRVLDISKGGQSAHRTVP